MPATPDFKSSIYGTVAINGNTFYVKSVSYNETCTLSDITHSGAGGFGVVLPAVVRASGDLTFTFDAANLPTGATYNMIPGTLMALAIAPDGVKTYTFNAYSGEFAFSTGAGLDSDVEVTVSYQSTGTITRPTA